MNRRQLLGFVIFPAALAGILAFLFFVANVGVFFDRPQLDHRDPQVRVHAALKAGHDRDRTALPRLREMLAKDPSPSARGAAAEALVRIDQAAAGPDLVPLLEDPDRTVRKLACYLLGGLRHEAAREPLRKRLAAGEDAPVRWQAAVALAAIGDRAALPVLHDTLKTAAPRGLGERAAVLVPGAPLADTPPGPDEQRNALLALGWLADPSSVEPVERLLAAPDLDPEVEKAARRTLERIQSNRPHPDPLPEGEGSREGISLQDRTP